MINSPLLQSERLCMRPVQEEDADELISLCRDSMEDYHHIDPPLTLSAFMDYLGRSQEPDWICWVLQCKKNKDLCGALNLAYIEEGPESRAHLGLYLGRNFMGLGLASEALSEAIPYCHSQLKLHELWATVHRSNKACIFLLQKHNFVFKNFAPDPDVPRGPLNHELYIRKL